MSEFYTRRNLLQRHGRGRSKKWLVYQCNAGTFHHGVICCEYTTRVGAVRHAQAMTRTRKTIHFVVDADYIFENVIS